MKIFDGVLLTRTAKLAIERHPMIQFTVRRGTPILYQDQSDISPVNTIKSLCKIRFENKGAKILSFDRMKDLLHNTYRFIDLTVF